MSVLDAIGNDQAAAFEDFAIDQVQVYLLLHFVKKRDTGSEQDRMDIKDHFIDQAGFKQTLRQLAAAEQADAFAFLAL